MSNVWGRVDEGRMSTLNWNVDVGNKQFGAVESRTKNPKHALPSPARVRMHPRTCDSVRIAVDALHITTDRHIEGDDVDGEVQAL